MPLSRRMINIDSMMTRNIKCIIIQLSNTFSFNLLHDRLPSLTSLILTLSHHILNRPLLRQGEIFNHSVLHTYHIECDHVLQVIQNDGHEDVLEELAHVH